MWPGAGIGQGPPVLQPGDRLRFPGITLSVLGLSVDRASSGTSIRLSMRAQTGPDRYASVDDGSFRIFAADIPRAPDSFSVVVPREAAKEFSVRFDLPDTTDDLVLRVRLNGATELRRLPPS